MNSVFKGQKLLTQLYLRTLYEFKINKQHKFKYLYKDFSIRVINYKGCLKSNYSVIYKSI